MSSDPNDSLWMFLGTLIMIGIPLVFSLRFGLLAPTALLTAVFVIGGSLVGPRIVVTVFFWPYFLALFLISGGAEYTLRTRGVVSTARQVP